MTYKYFNSSMLAFGLNITNVFKSLAKKFDNAENAIGKNLDDIIAQNDTYSARNYKVPVPITEGRPCRCKEIYDILAINSLVINDLSISNGSFNIDLLTFNSKTNKLTHLTGSLEIDGTKDIIKGYCIANEAVDNNNMERSISFVNNISVLDEDKLLFRYTLEVSDRLINLDNLGKYFKNVYYPASYTGHYKNLSVETVPDRVARGYWAMLGRTGIYPQYINHIVGVTNKDGTPGKYIYNHCSGINNGIDIRVSGIAYCYPGETIYFVDNVNSATALRIRYISGRRGKA